MGLVSVAAPSAIGQYVTVRMMSIAMGIWSTGVPIGSLIMFLFAPKLVLSYTTDIFWILLMIVIVLCFLFYAIAIPKQVSVKSKSGADSFVLLVLVAFIGSAINTNRFPCLNGILRNKCDEWS